MRKNLATLKDGDFLIRAKPGTSLVVRWWGGVDCGGGRVDDGMLSDR